MKWIYVIAGVLLFVKILVLPETIVVPPGPNLVETLVAHWLRLQYLRGLPFFQKTHQQLQTWEADPIVSTLTPGEFYGITGLDPQPIFGLQPCAIPCR